MFELHIRLALRSDITSLVTWNAALAWETEAKQLDTTVLERGVTAVFDEPRRGFYLVAEAERVRSRISAARRGFSRVVC